MVNGFDLSDEQLTLSSILGLPRQFIDAHREAIHRFERDDQGRVVKEAVFDAAGQSLWSLEYDWPDSAVFIDRRIEKGVLFDGSRLQLKLTWDSAGWLQEVRSVDDQGQPTPCPDGSFGCRLRCADSGLVAALEQLGRDGRPTASQGGPAIWKFAYDKQSRFSSLAYFDDQGAPAHHQMRHRLERKYDAGEYEDSYHLLAGHALRGIITLNENGDREFKLEIALPGPTDVLQEAFDIGEIGKTFWMRPDSLHPRRRGRYSEQGRAFATWQVGSNGQPLDAAGPFVTRMSIDSTGKLLEITNLNQAGLPVFDPEDGFARLRNVYDGNGSLIKSITERQDARGAWVTLREYNSARNPTFEAFFSTDGQPRTEKGVHRVELTYDARQNVVEKRFFGIEGQRIRDTDVGVHRIVNEFDDRGRQTGRRTFDEHDHPLAALDNGSWRWSERFDTQGNSLEIVHFDVADRPLVCKYGFAKLTRAYEADGSLKEKVHWVLDSAGRYIVQLRLDGKGRTVESAHFAATGEPKLVEGETYHRERYTYVPNSEDYECAYFDLDDRPVARKYDGTFKWAVKHDAAHRPVQWDHFDADGKPLLNTRDGYARRTLAYAPTGENIAGHDYVVGEDGQLALSRRWGKTDVLLEQYWFSPQGKRILNPQGCHHVRYEVNDQGRHTASSFFDIHDRPVLLTATGSHRYTVDLDEQGQVLGEAHFGLDGEPIRCSEGWHRARHELDGQGRRIATAVFDEDDRPVRASSGGSGRGSHRWTSAFDERGRRIDEAYFGLDGKPVNVNPGYARRTSTYDDNGSVQERTEYIADKEGVLRVKSRKFGPQQILIENAEFENDRPVNLAGQSHHRIRGTLDDQGRIISMAAYSVDELPVINAGVGSHRQTHRYDERGHLVEDAHFDVDAKPMRGSAGWHRAQYEVNDRGQRTAISVFDENDRPLIDKSSGSHRRVVVFDDRGRHLGERHFGTDGMATRGSDGWHRAEYELDDRGRRIATAVFDEEDRPVLTKGGGSHRWTHAYNERGRLVEQAYFGLDGKPLNVSLGYAKRTVSYDDNGGIKEQTDYVVDDAGVFRVRARRLGPKLMQVEFAQFKDGNPVTFAGSSHHRLRWTLDAQDRPINMAAFDLEDRPTVTREGFHRLNHAYDEQGHLIEEAHYDVEDRPANAAAGFAKRTTAYNDGGAIEELVEYVVDDQGALRVKLKKVGPKLVLIESAQFEDGRPVNFSNAPHHRIRSTVDSQGRFTSQAFFGSDDQPVVGSAGYHRTTTTYDGNRQLEVAYFDTQGRPVVGTMGYAKSQAIYDSAGQLAERRHFVLSQGRELLLSRRLNNRGKPVEEWFFDDSGRPILHETWGVHRVTTEYDEQGRKVLESNWDINGDAIAHKATGVARMRYSYDKNDARVFISTSFDAADKPVPMTDSGAHRLVNRLDDRGRVVEFSCYDADGKPMVSRQGFHRQVIGYDSDGNIKSRKFYAIDGTAVAEQ